MTRRDTAEPLPASFRDPSGFVFRDDGTVYRQISDSYAATYEHIVKSGFYRAAMDAGELIRHEEIDPESLSVGAGAYKILRPDQVPFVSYPYEWCFGQLRDAALLTLALQKRALTHGLWLRDASAYNVQYLGGRPIFIDTLSFEAYPEGRPWGAYNQFCQHFLAPLALAAYVDIGFLKLLRTNLGGIDIGLASRALPIRTRLRLGLQMHIHAHGRAVAKAVAKPEASADAREAKLSRNALLGLVDSLQSSVAGLELPTSKTIWGDYYDETNYSSAAHEAKHSIVERFVARAQPRTAWDLGANDGRFSRVASAAGAYTVAIDGDPAAVENNYRDVRHRNESHMLPLLMDLANPSPSLGWASRERDSISQRGPADLILGLALVHHLAIGNNVPLPKIAAFLAGLCRHLVIEFVPKEDSQVARLLATREDIFDDYSENGFEAAFATRFRLLDRAAVADSARTIYLYEAIVD